MKKNIKFFVRIFFTLILIIFALYKAGLLSETGRDKFINLVVNIKWGYVVLSFLLMFVLNLVSSVKWNALLKSKKIQVQIWRIYAYYNIGKFFSLILPTSMGGDIVRIYKLGKFSGKKHTATASVIIERFTGLLVLLLMTIIAVILNIRIFNELWLTIALIIASFVLTFLIWIITDVRIYNFFNRIFTSKIKVFEKLFIKLSKIRNTIIDFKADKKAMIWAFIYSIIFQILAILNVWISAKAFSNELDLITCIVAVPVIMFITNIPFSIGGIGLMEFGYVYTLSLFGISPSLAISTALLIRAKGIIDALLGGLLYAFFDKDKYLVKDITNVEQK